MSDIRRLSASEMQSLEKQERILLQRKNLRPTEKRTLAEVQTTLAAQRALRAQVATVLSTPTPPAPARSSGPSLMQPETIAVATPVDENLEAYHARVEAKFTYTALADCPDDAALPEFLRSPMVLSNLRVLREAERLGISKTTICVPKNVPVSHVAGFVPQKHYDPVKNKLSIDAIDVQADLFRLYYLLTQSPDARIHHEGMPFHLGKVFQFQESEEKDVRIPGTTVRLFSEEGQKMLFEKPDILLRTIRDRNDRPRNARSEYHHIFWQRPGQRIYGDQGDASHERTLQESTEFFKNAAVSAPYDGALTQISHGVQFRTTRAEPRQICIPKPGADVDRQGVSSATAYLFDLGTMVNDLEKYRQNTQLSATMNRRREQEILHRMTGIVPEGCTCDSATVPHVIYGASHKHEILNNAATNGVALLLTNLRSLQDFKDEEGHFYADQRNRAYHAVIHDILPLLKHALSVGRS